MTEVLKIKDEKINKDLDARYVLRALDAENVSIVDRDHDLVNRLDGHHGGIAQVLIFEKIKKIVAVGNDHRLSAYNFAGSKIFTGEAHDQPFTLIQLMEGDDGSKKLLSSNPDGRILLHDLLGKDQTIKFDANISSARDIVLFENGGLIGFLEPSGLSIWDKRGNRKITFAALKYAPKQVKQLPSGRWVLSHPVPNSKESGRAYLYSEDGEKIGDIGESSDLFSGVLETNDGKIIVKSNEPVLAQYSPKAELVVSYSEQSEVVSCSVELVKIRNKLITEMEGEPDVYKFSHFLRPPFQHDKKNPRRTAYIEDDPKKGLRGEDSRRTDRKLWSFFYRPNIMQIGRFFSSEFRKISVAQESLEKATDELDKRKSDLELSAGKSKTWGIAVLLLSFVVGLTGLLIGFLEQPLDLRSLLEENGVNSGEVMQSLLLGGGSGIALSVLFILPGVRKKRKSATRIGLQIALLADIQEYASATKKQIVDIRSNLLRQVATLKNGRVYSDIEVQGLLAKKIATKVRKVALEECGLDEEDLTGEGLPEYLNEWALLQPKSSILNMVDADNLDAFWVARDREPLFAVQHIQFIFPGKNKLDTFSCFYDVIKDKLYGKSAHAFFYRDVTNVMKRDVPREVAFSEDEMHATEVTLSVASGENITVTIRNEETNEQIHKHVEGQRDDLKSNEESIRRAFEDIDSNPNLTPEEREEEKAAYEQLWNTDGESEDDSIDPGLTMQLERADKLISHIRKQLRELKEA